MKRRAAVIAAIAAVAAPLPVLAIVLTSGQLVETTNYDATAALSYVNAAQCAGSETTNPLQLEWSINATGTFGGGSYRLFATDKEPKAETGSTATYCAEQSDPNASPVVNAAQVGNVTADLAVKQLAVSGNDAVLAAAKTCDASQEGQVLWICAHWYDDDSAATRSGYAVGKFKLQFAAPPAPTGVSAGSGDGRLVVEWTPSSGGTVLADDYVAVATPVGGGTPVESDHVNGSRATIDGLVNGTTYDVVVYAYSVGGNRSAASGAVQGTPQPVDDFWEFYRKQGGREEGGCASGRAGFMALAGVLALLALRRRK